MNRMYLSIFAAPLLATSALAQAQTGAQADTQAGTQTSVSSGGTQASGNAVATTSASAQNNGSGTAIAAGTEINAALSAPVDTKKAKPGDQVTAHATEAVKAQGKTIVPKGAKLVGHVTRASARGKGDAESTLGIVFDRAILKNGEEVVLNGSIQALASAETAASVAGADLDSMGSVGAEGSARAMSGGRGAVGGVMPTAGGAVGTVANTAGSATSAAGTATNTVGRTTSGVTGSAKGAVGGVTSNGQFAASSRGVFGLDGLNLSAAGSNSAEGSVITSGGKNVHLDNGTRMLIVAGTATQAGQTSAPVANKNPKPPKAPAH